MSKLSKEERDKLDSSDFALPSKKVLPIPDIKHLKLAWDMVDRTEGLSDAEREEARRNILKKAKKMGVDTSDWNKSIKAGSALTLYASSSNILLKDLEHPNRMPFRGILTYFDVPSDKPPGGASGNRVLIPKEIGEPALASLKGMAVNFVDGVWNGHDPQSKIGVITDAYLGDPQVDGAIPVFVEGYIYALDFQEAATSIKANQTILGFSYETAQTRLIPGEFRGEDVVIVKELGYFTGASILLKDSAAYQKTSIAANADDEGGNKVEDLKELLASSFDELKKEFREYVAEKLESLEALVKPEEEVKPAEPVAPAAPVEPAKEAPAKEEAKADLNANADLLAELKALKEQIADLKAEKEAAPTVPARKSIAYPMTLMAKFDVSEQDDATKLMASISERKDLSVEDRLALKMEARNKLNK